VLDFRGKDDRCVDEMWIFDIQTMRVSLVRKEGEWHPAVSCPFLGIRGQVLYIIGGANTIAIHSLSLTTLSRLIDCPAVRSPFCLSFGIIPPSNRELKGRVMRCRVPICL